MTDQVERLCAACSKPLRTSDRRAKWCSGRCRTWVHRVGGPTAAAGLKESWAAHWQGLAESERLGSPAGREEWRRTAAKLRREAEALRRLGG